MGLEHIIPQCIPSSIYTENIRSSLDKNEIIAGIFVHLQKAFDTVSHNMELEAKRCLNGSDHIYTIELKYSLLMERFQIKEL